MRSLQFQPQQILALPQRPTTATQILLAPQSRASTRVLLRSAPIRVEHPRQHSGLYFESVASLPRRPASSTVVSLPRASPTRLVLLSSPVVEISRIRVARPPESFAPRTLVFVDEQCIKMPDPKLPVVDVLFPSPVNLALPSTEMEEGGDPYRGGVVYREVGVTPPSEMALSEPAPSPERPSVVRRVWRRLAGWFGS